MGPRPPNTCLIHTGITVLAYITSSKISYQEFLRMFFSSSVNLTLFSSLCLLVLGLVFHLLWGTDDIDNWVSEKSWKIYEARGSIWEWGGHVVEVGCPPERAPELLVEGGHPIPLICRDRKRFVRGNFWKQGAKGWKDRQKTEQLQIILTGVWIPSCCWAGAGLGDHW